MVEGMALNSLRRCIELVFEDAVAIFMREGTKEAYQPERFHHRTFLLLKVQKGAQNSAKLREIRRWWLLRQTLERSLSDFTKSTGYQGLQPSATKDLHPTSYIFLNING